jgi:hypothetical protein
MEIKLRQRQQDPRALAGLFALMQSSVTTGSIDSGEGLQWHAAQVLPNNITLFASFFASGLDIWPALQMLICVSSAM